ncbi:putative procollagen-proline 4-dioxygenase [Helianthus anomalus]
MYMYFQILFLIVGLFENLEIALDSLAICGTILRCVLMISIGFNAATRYQLKSSKVATSTRCPIVLSWILRALYFPGITIVEQCDSIIKMAKVKLAPSTLALLKGETAENTKGISTSSGMFISASEDKTGILDQIEKKIERATMIPRSHGEAFNVLRYEIGQRYKSHYDNEIHHTGDLRNVTISEDGILCISRISIMMFASSIFIT